MSTAATDEILKWAQERPEPWQQDALRRIAGGALNTQDMQELYSMLKVEVGFPADAKAVAPIPINKTHLGPTSSAPSLQIASISNIKNVNNLADTAGLPFAPQGLTVIFGSNGSGKTGYIRILRSACRTRVTDPKLLKVLGNVYKNSAGAQSADINVITPAGNQSVNWVQGGAASEYMARATVFDSAAAGLYVDHGNQIRFLPFGLSLPFRLNELCVEFKVRLDKENKPCLERQGLCQVAFAPSPTSSKAKAFCQSITAKTTDTEIDAAAKWTDADELRLKALSKLLVGTKAEVTDRETLVQWLLAVEKKAQDHALHLNNANITKLIALQAEYTAARSAATAGAAAAFAGGFLAGTGENVWRRLWEAARTYAETEAYKGQEFPPVVDGAVKPKCVLCLQDLTPDALGRFKKFEDFVKGALTKSAEAAAQNLALAIKLVTDCDTVETADNKSRLAQVTSRAAPIAEKIKAHMDALDARKNMITKALAAGAVIVVPANDLGAFPAADAAVLVAGLQKEIADIQASLDGQTRAPLEAEKTELQDRKLAAESIAKLKTLRDTLREDGLYKAALAKVQTKSITQKAGELVDKHLTAAVKSGFAAERKALDIDHLKIALERKSDKTDVNYETKTGSTIKNSSEILSEGEQRALALAAYFTETGLSAADGPLIIDDPVSSLDYERSGRVADRIVEAAKARQVIVFTHDLPFFNKLCVAADVAGIALLAQRVVRNDNGTGLLDPSGPAWKGMPVKKRLNVLMQDAAAVGKLQATDLSRYEYGVKNVYGRLRDAYEGAIEEVIFYGTLSRWRESVETKRLRCVDVPDALAIRFHEGMTKANTFSHDNSAGGSPATPNPAELLADIKFLQDLIDEFEKNHKVVEQRRPAMK
ncbi:MAG: AAA family ATPase [Rhodospirillaceae bacterium]|nr:AAA family ATPase [Rhodospirillaceae bacterium]